MNNKQKLTPLIWKFSQIRHLIDQPTARLYYTSLIRPHLEYAAATIFNMSTKNVKLMETMQNKCLRIISQSHRMTPSNTMRKCLNIPTLENRRKYLYLCEHYKIRNSIIPVIFPPAAPPHVQYHLRSVTSSQMHMPRMNKKVGQRALDYLGPRTFNSLPDHNRTAATLSIFKTRLKRHLLQI